MNLLKYISRPGYYLIALVIIGFSACLPESADDSLGPQPTASFEIEPVSGKVNTYLLKNTTEGGFLFFWNTGNGFEEGNEVDTAYFPFLGEYEIGFRVLSPGGVDETSTSITVEETDPDACSGNLELLTGCDSKTWILNQPEGGALFVGPPGLESAWWQNTAGDVNAADRVCLFDNEYTFTVDGQYLFDNNGTMRVDDEGGAPWPTDIGLEIGCYDMEQIPEKYQAWGSGNHKFTVTDGKLRVIGTGAHLGLYKVGEGGTIDAPGTSVTYDIVSITEDLLVVKKEYDWGGWRFTFKAK